VTGGLFGELAADPLDLGLKSHRAGLHGRCPEASGEA
jgi:hypothetical protein